MKKKAQCSLPKTVSYHWSDLLARCLIVAILYCFTLSASQAQDAATFDAPKSATETATDQSLGNRSMPITSVEEADRLLGDVGKERAAINKRYREEETNCQARFFVTSCIDDAKERQRLALQKMRSIEVQANAFKRAAKVERRDKALEKRAP